MAEKTTHSKFSFILPCRNEEMALPHCLKKIKSVISKYNLDAEIVVSDSSTDKSPEIALEYGAVLAKHNKDGYGNAYLEGFKVAKGEIFILGDADDTYDFEEVPNLLKYIKDYDLVLGERKYLHDGSMPFLNRYIGNPILSWVLRFLFKIKVKDCHTGLRVIRKEALEKLNLQTAGMEFASEMIIKTSKKYLTIKEVPINYYPRKGQTKLKRLPDAWRHLRFMLLYSPLYLFFIPGLLIFLLGIISLSLHSAHMFFSSLLAITGYQLITFSAFAKIYSLTHLGERSHTFEKLFQYINIERASFLGIITIIIGSLILYFLTIDSIIAMTFITIGIQTIFSSFMLSILGIKEK